MADIRPRPAARSTAHRRTGGGRLRVGVWHRPEVLNLISDALRRSVRLRVTAAALRSVEHRGGLDAYLLKASDDELSTNARALKREILKKAAAGSAA